MEGIAGKLNNCRQNFLYCMQEGAEGDNQWWPLNHWVAVKVEWSLGKEVRDNQEGGGKEREPGGRSFKL